MARVEVIVHCNRPEFQDKINDIISGLKIGEFDIKFNAHESYPDGSDACSPERFYSAMIIIEDKK